LRATHLGALNPCSACTPDHDLQAHAVHVTQSAHSACITSQAAVAANKRRRAAAGAPPGVRDEDIGVMASLAVAALAGAGNQLITTPLQVSRQWWVPT
jgi:hypothetical protein